MVAQSKSLGFFELVDQVHDLFSTNHLFFSETHGKIRLSPSGGTDEQQPNAESGADDSLLQGSPGKRAENVLSP